MVIKANSISSIVWIIVAVLLVASLFVGFFVPRASADVGPEQTPVVPEVTSPTEIVEDQVVETTVPPVEETAPIEESIPEEETQSVDETQPAKPDRSPEKENHVCDHVWKDEYTPETETTEGTLIRECLKCGVTKLLETYPPISNE